MDPFDEGRIIFKVIDPRFFAVKDIQCVGFVRAQKEIGACVEPNFEGAQVLSRVLPKHGARMIRYDCPKAKTIAVPFVGFQMVNDEVDVLSGQRIDAMRELIILQLLPIRRN